MSRTTHGPWRLLVNHRHEFDDVGIGGIGGIDQPPPPRPPRRRGPRRATAPTP
ncbi:hypothetical protein [Kineococcus sp. SYSU DK003]|uniref:hypothetical protein n=1 Tax=Kineococcus sp. SYSU DK003 TaxID=3383124 RepID=UPI003D7D18CC